MLSGRVKPSGGVRLVSGVLVVVSGAALFAASGAVLVCGCAGLPRLPPKEASSGGVNPLGAVPCALPGMVNPVGIVNSPAPPKFMPLSLPLFMLPMSDVVMSLASTNASLFCCPCEVDGIEPSNCPRMLCARLSQKYSVSLQMKTGRHLLQI